MPAMSGALPRPELSVQRPAAGSSSNSNSFAYRNRGPQPTRARSDDWRLIQACKQGDPAAWNDLIKRYEKSVYKFAYTLARNYDDAGDIAGQVFVRLYENIQTFRNDSHFTSWLFCIVRNIYVDTCIRAPHRTHLSLDDGMEIEGDYLVREIVD